MRTLKSFRAVAAGGAALTLAATYLLSGQAAQAAAPESLAVFFAGSTATPVGVISRVPAETAGGMILSNSQVQLGKSQALAAGGTLGALGDAFLVTSAPPGTITQVPSVITAQDPPSETAPRQAALSGGRGGGGGFGEIRNIDLSARASDFPEAGADASGNAIVSALFSTGASVSRSVSSVLPDGTVTTEAFTAMQNVVIGPAPAPLTIASVSGLATIVIRPGAKPTSTLQVGFHGAQLAGVPVIIDAQGIRIADQVAMPSSTIQTFNEALAGLGAQGFSVAVTPPVTKQSSGGVELSGSAMTIRYKLPDSPIPRPSDIGSDETFEIGHVKASATARGRQPLDLGTGDSASALPTDSAAAGVDSASAGTGALPTTGDLAGQLLVGALPAPAAVDGGPTLAAPVGFALPPRATTLAPDQVRLGYRYVLLGTALGLIGLVAIVRKRPLV